MTLVLEGIPSSGGPRCLRGGRFLSLESLSPSASAYSLLVKYSSSRKRLNIQHPQQQEQRRSLLLVRTLLRLHHSLCVAMHHVSCDCSKKIKPSCDSQDVQYGLHEELRVHGYDHHDHVGILGVVVHYR
jgi:hypothetical protein